MSNTYIASFSGLSVFVVPSVFFSVYWNNLFFVKFLKIILLPTRIALLHYYFNYIVCSLSAVVLITPPKGQHWWGFFLYGECNNFQWLPMKNRVFIEWSSFVRCQAKFSDHFYQLQFSLWQLKIKIYSHMSIYFLLSWNSAHLMLSNYK